MNFNTFINNTKIKIVQLFNPVDKDFIICRNNVSYFYVETDNASKGEYVYKVYYGNEEDDFKYMNQDNFGSVFDNDLRIKPEKFVSKHIWDPYSIYNKGNMHECNYDPNLFSKSYESYNSNNENLIRMISSDKKELLNFMKKVNDNIPETECLIQDFISEYEFLYNKEVKERETADRFIARMTGNKQINEKTENLVTYIDNEEKSIERVRQDN